MKLATDAIIFGLELGEEARKRLYDHAAHRIDYYQRRNAAARTSHTRTTISKLQRQGIMLTGLPRCDEKAS